MSLHSEDGQGILDMLFDGEGGVLGDVADQALIDHTINMDDLDYLSSDFLDDILQFPINSITDGPSSPGNSDSGVSLDGIDDTQKLYNDSNYTHDHSYTTALSTNHSSSNSNQSHNTKDHCITTCHLNELKFDITETSYDVFDESIFDTLDTNVSIEFDPPVKAVNSRKTSILKLTPIDTLPVTVNDINPLVESYNQLPELRLSDEEKLLLAQEGFVMPSHLPLTKEEERQLKGIRRKIRNKISAKESRKRKMTYVDGLENRVKVSTVENAQLRKKVCALETQNISLVSQLKKLQAMLGNKTNKTAHTTTCVSILALSFMFILIPTYSPLSHLWAGSGSPETPPTHITPGNSRSLLHNQDHKVTIDHDLDPFGVTSWPRPPWSEPQQSESLRYTLSDNMVEQKKAQENFVVESGRQDGANDELNANLVYMNDIVNDIKSKISVNNIEINDESSIKERSLLSEQIVTDSPIIEDFNLVKNTNLIFEGDRDFTGDENEESLTTKSKDAIVVNMSQNHDL